MRAASGSWPSPATFRQLLGIVCADVSWQTGRGKDEAGGSDWGSGSGPLTACLGGNDSYSKHLQRFPESSKLSQFGSLGYTIMGKTADLTVVQKTIIDTLHKEGKQQIIIIIIIRFFLFVTYTIIQSITSSDVFSAFNPSKCTHTWSSEQPTLRRPGSSRGFGALLKRLTSVVDNS